MPPPGERLCPVRGRHKSRRRWGTVEDERGVAGKTSTAVGPMPDGGAARERRVY
jgi:hypothetical protein